MVITKEQADTYQLKCREMFRKMDYELLEIIFQESYYSLQDRFLKECRKQ